jgi:hypothetical protein
MSLTSPYSRWIAALLLCLGGSVQFPPLGYAGSYDDDLRVVETEAKRLATTLKTANAIPLDSSPSMPATLDIVTNEERLPLGLQPDAFEKTLREEFLGTYAFYQKLSAEDRQWVFQLYQQDNRISVIRQQTLQLLSGGKP